MKSRSGLVVLLLMAFSFAQVAIGQDDVKPRPKAVDLLPDRTVVYIQVDDIQKMFQDFSETGFGQMLNDEQIAPFVSEIYGEAQSAYADVEDQVGVSFADLESLPQGEICFAVVTPRRADPAVVFMMDVNTETTAAEDLLARGRELAEDDGAELTTEEIQGLEINVIGDTGDDFQLRYLLHEGTFLACSNEELLAEMLQRWLGEEPIEDDRTLLDNRKFVTIMNKCRSTEDIPMSMSFFVDPIELARGATRGQIAAQAMLGALPILGLDGLLGIGGASVFNEQGYESIFHLHVLLANPRAGILEMIALKPGNYQPEPFVPADVVTYATSAWDFRQFVAELEKIVDTFSAEGTFNAQIEDNINEELGIDFRGDFLENLDGRITYMAWIEPPARFNSQVNAGAIEITDMDKFQNLLDVILEQANQDDENVVRESYHGVDYWAAAEDIGAGDRRRRLERLEEQGIDPADDPEIELRPMRPCFVILDNHFIITESPAFLERVIDTYRGDEPALIDDELFQKTTREMTQLLGTQMPAVTMYSRPDLTFKMWFEFMQADNTRNMLSRGAEDNKYVAGLQRVIEDNPLPDFDEVSHYFAPSGAFITNDDTGFHMLAFQIKAGEDN